MVRRILYVVLGGVGLIFLLWLTTHQDGIAEFSPHAFEYRTHSELRLFGTTTPWYRLPYKRRDHEIVKMLIEEGFVSPQPEVRGRWELVYHISTQWNDGYAPLYDV